MKIYVRTESTVVSEAQLESWLPSLQIFVNQVAGAWRIQRPTLRLGKPERDSEYQVVILDNSDQAGALGYHDDPSGTPGPISKIFAKDDLKYGASITVTITHELAEMMADPDIVRAMQTDNTRMYALELGDPVESDSFAYDIHGVKCSDFALPAWFMPGSAGPYDFKGHCSSPLQVLPQGYAQYFENGRWNQTNEHGEVTGPGERQNRFRPRTAMNRMD